MELLATDDAIANEQQEKTIVHNPIDFATAFHVADGNVVPSEESCRPVQDCTLNRLPKQPEELFAQKPIWRSSSSGPVYRWVGGWMGG